MRDQNKQEGRMQESDVAAFNAIYVEHSSILRGMAVRYGVQPRDAEDIVHDTFLAYCTHYPLDWESKKMKAMLTRILKNKCIDYLRKTKKVEIDLGIDTLDEEYGRLNLFTTQDGLSVVLKQEESQRFWDAMKRMRSDWQDVFFMYFMQGYPIREVGKILGISEEACRTRISRGRNYLKSVLKEGECV